MSDRRGEKGAFLRLFTIHFVGSGVSFTVTQFLSARLIFSGQFTSVYARLVAFTRVYSHFSCAELVPLVAIVTALVWPRWRGLKLDERPRGAE
ncbi:MAG: hypothetical protein WAN05_15565, partial [Roseiarcus sp.]